MGCANRHACKRSYSTTVIALTYLSLVGPLIRIRAGPHRYLRSDPQLAPQNCGFRTEPRPLLFIHHPCRSLLTWDRSVTSQLVPRLSVSVPRLMRHKSVFFHIATVIGVGDSDYRESVAELALISRSSGSLVISHLPYNKNNAPDEDVSISVLDQRSLKLPCPLIGLSFSQEKQLGGPVHAWFSSCGCLAWVPQENAVPLNAMVSLVHLPELHKSSLLFCSTMGNLSRYRGLSVKGANLEHLKLGSIYLQRPGDLEVAHPIAEISRPDPEIIIEDWATRKGAFEEVPGGWTR